MRSAFKDADSTFGRVQARSYDETLAHLPEAAPPVADVRAHSSMEGPVLRSLFPSMFHRRLLLLFALSAGGFGVIGAQMSRLTLTRTAEARSDAESRLVRRQWTPTVRGRILDRKDRVLAQDRAGYAVKIDYAVLSGEWSSRMAARLARRSAGVSWRDLAPDERDARIARIRGLLDDHLDRAWNDLAIAAGVPRSEIDLRRTEIVERVERMYRSIVDRRREEEVAAIKSRSEPVTTAEQEIIERRVTQPIQEQQIAHILLPAVSDDAGFALRTLEAQTRALIPESERASLSPDLTEIFDPSEEVEGIPGMRVADAGERDYPLENLTVTLDARTLPSPERRPGLTSLDVRGVGTHVLGWMRSDIRKEDVDARRAVIQSSPALRQAALTPDGLDRGEYQPGDRVGHVGVEAAEESTLRGLRGSRETHLDTGEQRGTPPEPGGDVRLTLDIMLQARIQAAMTPELGLARVQPWHHQDSPYMAEGTALNGAAVVLEIDTGEILALVSTPSFTREDVRLNPDAVFGDDVNVPYLNRAIAKSYTPGSIVKALVLAEALTRGNYLASQRIACTGHLVPNQPDAYRCWIYKRYGTTHSDFLAHDLSGPEALSVSCNIFFFTLGRRMGPEGIAQAFEDFDVGRSFNLGIGQEFSGQIGVPAKEQGRPNVVRPEDAIQMAIGQGPVVWTPLHAANAYATLARGGVVVPPKLVRRSAMALPPREVSISPEGVREAMEGLKMAVNAERGTGRVLTIEQHDEPIFNAPGVDIWGKTGTADAPDQYWDPDGPGGPRAREIVRAGDHSWFVVMVGPEGGRPQYVIAIVMDYAGSGAKVSGPICNQAIHALIDEGYLPGKPADSAPGERS